MINIDLLKWFPTAPGSFGSFDAKQNLYIFAKFTECNLLMAKFYSLRSPSFESNIFKMIKLEVNLSEFVRFDLYKNVRLLVKIKHECLSLNLTLSGA